MSNDALRALKEVELAFKFAMEANADNDQVGVNGYLRSIGDRLPTLRAALTPPATPSPPEWLMELGVRVDPPADGTLRAIRARHEVASSDPRYWSTEHVETHDDRATLLPLAERCAAAEARVKAATIVVSDLMTAFKDHVAIPDPNCACHVNPPCSDCETWGHAREAYEDAAQLLKDTP